jgi:8-oxo-dGTP diphosphatase
MPRRKRLPIACVGAVVHDDARRLLLVRRRNDPGRGRWSVPGGRVEPGESGPDATRREVHEETGLDVVVGTLLGRVEIPGDPTIGTSTDAGTGTGTDGTDGTDTVFVVDDYACTVRGGTLRPGDDAVDARWADRAELDSLQLVDGLREALTAWNALPD